MKTHHLSVIYLIALFSILLLTACDKSQPSPAAPSSSSVTASGEMAYDAESDHRLLQDMKDGKYFLQEKGVSAKRHSVQFSFTRMEFFINFAKIEEPVFRQGPIAIKNGYIYAVCQNTHQVFVFKILDDHSLAFCADRSNELTIQGNTSYVTIQDADVFVWEEGKTFWDALDRDCSSAPPTKESEAATPSETIESTPDITTEPASEESTEAAPQKEDWEWAQCLKSGSYVPQEALQAPNPFNQKIRGIDFSFRTMAFSKGPEQIYSDAFVLGLLIIKDDYLYAIWPAGQKIFVFKIVDDHTLIFCADRSHPMLSSGKARADGTVYVWQSSEYWSGEPMYP